MSDRKFYVCAYIVTFIIFAGCMSIQPLMDAGYSTLAHSIAYPIMGFLVILGLVIGYFLIFDQWEE